MSDNVEDLYPLTPLQRGLLFHELRDRGGGLYVNQLVCELGGPLDVAAFEGAWREALRLNPVLRSAFEWEGLDEPLQVVLREVDLPFFVDDWRAVPPGEREGRLERLLEDERRRGFAFDEAPLLRLWLLRTGESSHRFVFSHHHILLDGWSLPNLLQQVFAAYDGLRRGSPPALEPPPPFRDYVGWLGARGFGEAEAFFRRTLGGFEGPPPLGSKAPREPGPGGRGEASAELPPDATRALGEAARRRRLTLNTFVQGAWALLLGAWSGRRDVVYGTTVSGRPPELPGVEQMVGLFINTLPVRARWSPGERLADWLAALQAGLLELRQHEHAPLYEVRRWAGLPAEGPLFESIVVFENYPVDAALRSPPGLAIGAVRAIELDHFPLSLTAVPGPALRLALGFDRARFDDAFARAALERLGWLLGQMATHLDEPVGALPLLSEAERRRALCEWNPAPRAARPGLARALLEAQAARRPDAVAVEEGGERMSYGEWEQRSNRLARVLRRRGVGPDDRVALCFEPSRALLVAMLAVLKAGAGYVPLDPTYPAERLSFMLRDARARLLLRGPPRAGAEPGGEASDGAGAGPGGEASDGVGAGPSVETIDWAHAERASAREPSEAPPPAAGPESLAYVIYTSGSTGTPKGVMVSNAALVAYAEAFVQSFGLDATERVLHLQSVSFDGSVEEIYPCLLAGGTLVVRDPEALATPERFAAYVEAERVTFLDLPTALWARLGAELSGRAEGLPRTLRRCVVGGEAMAPGPALAWRRWAGRRASFSNSYGPTEATVIATACDLNALDEAVLVGGEVPLGRPLPNARAYVLDAQGRLLPEGAEGEIYLGGESLARGYLGRPGLTAERFVPDPFSPVPGSRMYRTGDLGRWLRDGQIAFAGRADRQLKLRGFRVEPGEIEAALERHPDVRQALVVARDTGAGGQQLVAYLVPAAGRALDPEALRALMRQSLPEYLVPSAFVPLEALPLTPAGKLDRRALPAPGRVERAGDGAPVGPVEELLAAVWAEVLGREGVGRDENFFELGGHSLLAMQLASRVREAFGVELSVRAAFEAPTLRELAERVARARGEPPPAPLVLATGEGPARASFAQERLWFLDRLHPGSAAYNVPSALRLRGPLDVEALRGALQALVDRHEALRTTFVDEGQGPFARVAPSLAFTLPVEAIEEAGDEALRARAEEEARRPFDLERGPLLRARLLRAGEGDHALVLTAHHVICDAWSLDVLARELSSSYAALARGAAPRLPDLPARYADYAAWQRARLEGGALEGELAWWRSRLEGAPPALALPTDRPRPALQSLQGAQVHASLPTETAAGLRELCRRERVTPFMALLAAFYALLWRQSGQDDLVVGTPVSGRGRREFEGLVGLFLNTLALRVRLDGGMSFRDLLARVREASLDAFARQELPFERLVGALAPSRDPGRSPLFQALFVHEGAPTPLALPGVEASPFGFEPGWAKFDLTLFTRERGGSLECTWEYDRALFDAATVERWAAHYGRLLAGALADPERPVDEIRLSDESDRRRLLALGRGAEAPAPAGVVHALFEAQARRSPEAPALRWGEERLSYGELDRRAERLARRLRELGVGRDVPVGLCARRSFDLAAGLLGILKAGGACVPLDPAHPPARLAGTLRDAGAPLVLAQRPLAGLLPDDGPARLFFDEAEAPAGAALPSEATRAGAEPGPSSLAYVLYTSGSTGAPKGVAMAHGPLVNLVAWQLAASRAPGATTLQFAAFGFDVCFQELFATWAGGGELVLIDEEQRRDPRALLRLVDEGGIERLFLPFVALEALAEAADRDGLAPRRLREVVTAGEALRVTPALRRFFARLPGAVLHNQYGPTESHVVTAFTLEADPQGWPELPPIGRPIAGATAQVLDATLEPAPIGVPGELYLGGVPLARGYFGRPALTAERFVPDPFGRAPGGRLYRSGDVARLLPSGDLAFLGRSDAQVKVRGHRVELGEIEAALAAHGAVAACAVDARQGPGGHAQLVAYAVGRAGRTPPAAEEFVAFLRARLPEYMVPAAFVALEALPLGPTGKVDRRALPAPGAWVRGLRPAYVEPSTESERRLAGLWAELLGAERPGALDDFFELGGHSLLATRLASRVRSVFGVELPLRAIFEATPLRALAARIDASVAPADAAPPPRRRAPGEPPTLSFAQQRLWLLDRLAPGDPAYNVPVALRLRGELDAGALGRALAALAGRHEALRTTFDERGGRPVALVHDEAFAPTLRAIDLRALDDDAREPALAGLAAAEAGALFDLRSGPLVRAALARLGEREHALLLTAHHAATDGWSTAIVVRELAFFYEGFARGEAPRLPELPLQYADYAAWQRERLAGPALRAELDHWQRVLEGAPRLELPTDRPRRSDALGRRAGSAPITLPAPLAGRLRALSAEAGATPFMALLAAFQALLARYAGTNDVSVGTPVAGRTRLEFEGLVGLFVNTLVLRTRVEPDRSFRALLGRARETCLDAFAHQELPFERLVEELRPERDLSGTPLFRAFFSLQNAPRADAAVGGLAFEPIALPIAAAKFDLSLRLEERDGAFEGALDYRADLFEQATAERLARHFGALLEAALAGPDRPLESLPLLDEGERKQLLEAGAGGPRAGWGTLGEALSARAAEQPRSPALAFGARTLSFAELEGRANQIGRALRRRGVGPGAAVGVCLPRSLELIVGIWGVLKAGAAYVPLDPSYPPARLELMARDAGLRLALCTHATSALVAGAETLALDESAPAWAESGEPLPSGASPDGLAYILYTSGSTGRPKGVAVRQGAVRNLVAALREPLGLGGRARRFSLNGSVSFDTSVKQIFQSLEGHALDVTPEADRYDVGALLDYLERQRIDVFDCTPTHLRPLLAAGLVRRARPGLKVLVGGEPIDEALWAELAAAEGAEFFNLYGPTECTVDASAARVRDWPRPALGRPLAGVRLYALDGAGGLAPPGAPAELYVGGAGVARGYFGRAAPTAERFVPDPFAPEAGARLYRTGDQVRLWPNGRFELLGRVDQQLKVRGVRVELGEIEAALHALPGVRRAAAALRDGRLVAYVEAPAGFEPAAAERRLRAALPDALVPSAFVAVTDWPLSPAGKLDRSRLPEPSPAGAPYVAPSSPSERALAALWQDVLGVERVGAGDHFFELGGHSLLAAQVLARVRASLGVELPLRALFEAPTLAALAARVDEAPPGVEETPLRRRGDSVSVAPLSPAQERLWFLQRLEPRSPAYNVPFALRLGGALDRGALTAALGAFAERHEVVRSALVLEAGEPGQRVVPSFALRPRFVDLGALEPAAREAAARALAEAEARRPFSFEEGPPARALLVALAERDHLLVITLHHALTDGWSTGVMTRELAFFYEGFARGEAPRLPELPLQYADYAAWQRERLAGPALRAELDHWRRVLGGVPPLELPFDHPRDAASARRSGHEPLSLGAATTRALGALCRRAGATPFMALAAALKALLHRYSGQTDLALGTPVAGRSRPELEPLVGCFVNTLVLRTDLTGDPSFHELLARVRDVTLDALAHQELPFEQIVGALGLPRDAGRPPLVQAMLALHHAPAPAVRLPGLVTRAFEADAGAPKLDLLLELHEASGGLEGGFEYDAGRFDAATVAQLSRHFARLLEAALDAPERPISALPLVDEAERRSALAAGSGAVVELPPGALLHRLFEAQARRTPDAEAVVAGGEALTYRELEARADRLAWALREQGVGPERRVGVYLERSAGLVVALLAVLKAGGAYVPLDPDYPDDRLAFMLRDSGASALIAQRSQLGALPVEGLALVCLDGAGGRLDSGASARASASPASPASPDRPDARPTSPLPPGAPPVGADHAAYVIYTSGSTGRPKGAINEHRAVVNRLLWMQAAYPLAAGDRVLHKTPFSFDVSVWELFWPLLVGATLVVARPGGHRDPAYLERALDEHAVRVVHFVPSMLRAFFDALGERPLPASLRHVLCSGEELPADLVARFFEHAGPGQRLHNLYGPTEAAVDVSAWACRPEDGRPGAPVPIGLPIDNARLYVLDRHARPAPVGVPGELCIGGLAVGRGYLGRPALTAERFAPDPFGPPGSRLYQTGDRARWRREGGLEFLGRLDRQIKLRGHRIEPAEIEATLLAHPGLRACAVALREAPGGDHDLVAYLVPADGAGDAFVASVEAFARQRLPAFLRPAHFVGLEALPTTASGKLDRRALPAPSPRPRPAGRAPRDERERALVRIWQDVLGVSPLGIDDDFFELGGHSLRALRALARAEVALGRPLPLALLFEHPTVAALVSALDAPPASPLEPSPCLLALRTGGERVPLFLVHAIEGHAFAYRDLARALGPGRPVYALRARGLEPNEVPLDDVEGMGRHYLDELRRVRPRGPYALGGWSAGGTIAFEMARQLANAGEGPVSLALLDAFAPDGTTFGLDQELALLAALGHELALLSGFAPPNLTPDELRQLPAPDRVAHLVERALGGRALSADVAAFRPEALARVALANARALSAYRPASYEGPALLLRASERRDAGRPSPERGWAPFAPNLQTQAVAGDHHGIMRPPHVRELAEALDRWLERQAPAAPRSAP